MIFLILIIIRLLLIFTPGFKIDSGDWQAWTVRLVDVGPSHFYAPGYFADYFPGVLYLLWFLGSLLKFLDPTFNFFSNNFLMILRIIATFFEVGTSVVIYKIVSRYQKNWAAIAAYLYLANPALIFNTSVWGQVDGVVTFFLILGTYFLLDIKKAYQSSFIYSLALLVKPQALAVVPITFFYLIRQFQPKIVTFFIAIFLLTTFLISWPFFTNNPIFGLFNLFQQTAAGYQYTSLYAFNFWQLIGWWKPDSLQFLNLTYQTWGIILYLIATVLIIFPAIKHKNLNPGTSYLLIALSFLSFYLFPTRVHDRYLFPFFAFFVIAASILRNIKFLLIYFLLSVIHLSNLWYVYFYYNTIYGNSNFHGFWLFNLITTLSGVFSVITLLSFIYLLGYVYFSQKTKT